MWSQPSLCGRHRSSEPYSTLSTIRALGRWLTVDTLFLRVGRLSSARPAHTRGTIDEPFIPFPVEEVVQTPDGGRQY